MKKFLACAAALALAFIGALAACGEDGQGEEQMKERELRNLPADVVYEYTKEEYQIAYTDGALGEIELYGEKYEPVGVDGAMPAVIMAHGFNGHHSDFPNECKRLARRGYVAYAFDFAGAQSGGRSTGRTEDDYTPFTMKKDLVEVFKHIKGLSYVDGTQVFLWGGSQGGFVSALAAADDEIKNDVAGLALYFPAFNIPDDWRGKPEQKTPLMGYSIGADFIGSVQDFDPYAVIPAYKKDVCIVWGENDTRVARTYVEQAVAAYGADRASLTVLTGTGAGHGFGEPALTDAIDTVMAFLEARTYKPL